MVNGCIGPSSENWLEFYWKAESAEWVNFRQYALLIKDGPKTQILMSIVLNKNLLKHASSQHSITIQSMLSFLFVWRRDILENRITSNTFTISTVSRNSHLHLCSTLIKKTGGRKWFISQSNKRIVIVFYILYYIYYKI